MNSADSKQPPSLLASLLVFAIFLVPMLVALVAQAQPWAGLIAFVSMFTFGGLAINVCRGPADPSARAR